MQYRDTLVPVVRWVRDMAMPGYGSINAIDLKSDNPIDVVTEIDRRVESYLSRQLHHLYPGIPFVGEEFGGNRNADQFWLSDPIDCTSNYMRGLPGCSSLLALIENGEPVVGVIYDFVNDQLYYAEKGMGAYVDGARVMVSTRPPNAALISYETRGKNEHDQRRIVALINQFPNHRALSSGMEFAHIAAGRIDGLVTFDPFGDELDFSAGALLVREAGGVVTNVCRDVYDYRDPNIIAANQLVYEKLSQIMRWHTPPVVWP